MKKLLTLLLIALSVKSFSTDITFNVKMYGQPLPYETVFIVGAVTNWEFAEMFEIGDSVYTYTTSLDPGTVDSEGNDSLSYYFITVNSWDSAGNEDWNYYKRYKEYFDSACAASYPLRWGVDRWIVVPEESVTVMCYFGKCPNWEPSSGIKDMEETTSGFYIYPNPTDGDVSLHLPATNGLLQIDLMDISGKLIVVDKSVVNTSEVRLQTRTLPKGIYFIRASGTNFSGIKKLVVK